MGYPNQRFRMAISPGVLNLETTRDQFQIETKNGGFGSCGSSLYISIGLFHEQHAPNRLSGLGPNQLPPPLNYGRPYFYVRR